MKFEKEFKKAISHLPSKEKDKLLLRLLKKDLDLASRLHFELLSTDTVEEQRERIEKNIVRGAKMMNQRFYSVGYLNMEMRDLSGEINHHVKITKDKFGEASLNLLLLVEVLKHNNANILSATPGKARKFCVALIARIFKVLILINKIDDDYMIEFEDGLQELAGLLGQNDYLMRTAIHHSLDANWLAYPKIPENIDEIHKDLRKRGYLK